MNAIAINRTAILNGFDRVTTQSLPDTCTIQRRTQASDGAGGQTDTWADLYTDVPIRVEPFSAIRAGTEQVIAMKLTSLEPRIVVLQRGQDVLVEDRIVYQGTALEVKGISAPLTFEVIRQVICEVVQ